MPSHVDTIAALATPAGTAALAVLRASGPECARLAREIFGVTPLPRRVRHSDYRAHDGALVDDVVWIFFAGPKSYAGEDALEISCHGSPFIAQKILEDLLARGCRAAAPGEFTQRAFLNGKMALSEAEAVMDVIHARSERALAAAQAQLRGALGRQMEALTGALTEALALVEAYIDFPEEDLPPEDSGRLASLLTRVDAETGRLIATSRYGAALRDGIKTVIVGAPNVGKSSLLNRLVGFDRAIISEEAGTTRDFIEERIAVGSHCLRLIDTAGLREQESGIEALGMEKTREKLAEADLVLVVVTQGECAPHFLTRGDIKIDVHKILLINNKSDLIHHISAKKNFPWKDLRSVQTSALTGEGIDELRTIIAEMAETIQGAMGEDLVAINARHHDALERGRRHLTEALKKARADTVSELLASDIRGALDALGEISGRFDNEQMLNELFNKFCIGK